VTIVFAVIVLTWHFQPLQVETRDKEYEEWKKKEQQMLEQGRKEGLVEGRLEGLQEGRLEERRSLVRQMQQNGMTMSQIAKLLSADEAEIEKLLSDENR
jgi:predicted transposase/invertase (TIGR01784 family)